MPADHLPSCHTHFTRPNSLFLLCSTSEPGWIACHGNNPPSLLLPISPLLCKRTSLNKRHPPPNPSCLLSFLLLHSWLISSIQWTWLLCFCNSQFDFSLIEDLINFSSGSCLAGGRGRGRIRDSWLYSEKTRGLICEAAVEPRCSTACVCLCTHCIYPATLEFSMLCWKNVLQVMEGGYVVTGSASRSMICL